MATAAGIGGLVGCGAVLGIEPYELDETADAGDGAVPANDGAFPADATDEDGGTDDLRIDDSGCPIGRGPVMVRIDDAPTFCIDATEVTRAQYRRFLDAKIPTTGQEVQCRVNTDYNTGNANDAPADLPVSAVDWCDALAFCKWTGKRLCAGRDGLPGGEAGVADSTRSQWFAACSHAGTLAYPYGNANDAHACNVNSAGPVAVASFASCVGGYPGLFDMAGNVAEWTDECDRDPNGDPTECYLRGGAFNSSTGLCATTLSYTAVNSNVRAGFRCCAP